MNYWDTSAILPLLVWEPKTHTREAVLRADPTMVTWWGTEIECHSAIRRKEREGALNPAGAGLGIARLEAFSQGWYEVAPSDSLRSRAQRLLKFHQLRAADALQLAAALLACNEQTSGEHFYTSDQRLAAAAAVEGFIAK